MRDDRRDDKLTLLVILAALFSAGHTVDHVLRGDLPWPLTLESLPFLVVSLAIYTVFGSGLYLYRRGKVGPRFWTVLGGAGVAFGWLAHFSPVTEQPPRYILRAYESAAAGWIALSGLVALMLLLVVATIYAAYLWKRAT